MRSFQRQPRFVLEAAAGLDSLRRLLEAWRESLRGPRWAPVAVPVYGPSHRPAPAPPSIHMVFGRRKEESPKESGEQGGGTSSDESSDEADAKDLDEFTAQLPPLNPAPGGESEAASGDTPAAESSWSNQAPEEGSPFAYEPLEDSTDLPAWTPGPYPGSSFPPLSPESDSTTTPWSAGEVEEPQGEASAPAEAGAGTDDGPAWPASAPDTPVWSGSSEETEETHLAEPAFSPADEELAEPAPAQQDEVEGEEAAEVEEVPSYAPEPAEEVPAESPTWAPAAAEPSPYLGFPAASTELAAVTGTVALVEEARAFPLPEGEVIFRNLRSAFTDPARLLRHLAGEGHTGVMHVTGGDQRNSYIVLVDGYVVAVADDDQGKLTTTNRVSFPSFPNSEDILNVIAYPREIARGLGLLLHAPVHYRGLGAMFVNLDGLRSYLSKHSASGGMVVESDTGCGVALFDDGRLVGAYAGNQGAEADLSPLRELIKDLDAEIDVRFGGPKDLDPVPLDSLLSGYPL